MLNKIFFLYENLLLLNAYVTLWNILHFIYDIFVFLHNDISTKIIDL